MQLRRRIVPTKSKWSTPVIAAITSISLVAAAAFGGNEILNTQEQGTGPIDALSATASLGEGETVVVDDPAIATQGQGDGKRAVKQFHRDQEFSMFAVTWKGQRDVTAFVRAKQADGTWSEWYDMDALKNGESGTNGTELIWVGPTHDVQVNVGNVDMYQGTNLDSASAESGDAPSEVPVESDKPAQQDKPAEPAKDAEASTEPSKKATVKTERHSGGTPLPTNYGDIKPVADATTTGGRTNVDDLDVVFMDGNARASNNIMPTATTDGMPEVVTRAGWGANEDIRCQGPTYDDGVKALTLHHTAGSNDYTPAQAAAQVRGAYQYHAQTLGWCDIGYNALVDKFGTIYEGRYGGLDKAVQGAHVGGFNSNTWGISMVGNYESAQPSQQMLNSVAEIAGWKAAISGFDPTGTASLYSGGFGGSRFPAGTTATVPAFHGHNDLHYTSCPGQYTTAQWPAIRTATKAKYTAVKAGKALNPTTTTPTTKPGTSTQATTSTKAPTSATTTKQPSQQEPSTGTTGGTGTGSTSSLGGVQVPVSAVQAVAGIAATLFGILVASGRMEKPTTDTEVGGGLTLGEIPNLVSKIVAMSGDEGAQESWTAVLNAFGPALGMAVGGPETDASGIVAQLFENGVVLASEETGTHALIGEIAKKWSEGDNSTELGLPVTNQEPTGDGKEVRVKFQGGEITYDPATEKINVYTD